MSKNLKDSIQIDKNAVKPEARQPVGPDTIMRDRSRFYKSFAPGEFNIDPDEEGAIPQIRDDETEVVLNQSLHPNDQSQITNVMQSSMAESQHRAAIKVRATVKQEEPTTVNQIKAAEHKFEEARSSRVSDFQSHLKEN